MILQNAIVMDSYRYYNALLPPTLLNTMQKAELYLECSSEMGPDSQGSG